MTQPKQRLDDKIAALLRALKSPQTIARRLFLYDFAFVFENDSDRGFAILDAVSTKFSVPFSAIRIVGSAQTGYSYTSSRDFLKKESDLDLAIINPALFAFYSQAIYSLTNRYSDLSKFPRKQGFSTAQQFRYHLASGNFRPDLMPDCPLKTAWFGFFNQLSNRHVEVFGNINAGIYLSETFFELKSASIVEAYKKGIE